MVNANLERAWELKQALVDFVLDAEDELAEALETYVAKTLKQHNISQDFVVDMFAIEGKVGNKTPIELFIESEPELQESDRLLLKSWQRTFTGLFAIEQVLPDGFELMNWLTAKRYVVKPSRTQATPEMAARFKPGEIVLTRISPVTDTDWMFSTSYSLLGKLGKPKLAVAIGNFKDNHPSYLYADAPDLLQEAWNSVEVYHQTFLDFFGSDEVTLPGYQLNKKMGEFQELLAKQYLAAAGLDGSKSLDELAAEAGMTEEDLIAAAEEAGVDPKEMSQVLQKNGSNGSSKMVAPQVQLPDTLKKAEQVTVLADARWGQMFLPNHTKLKSVLEAEDWQSVPNAERLIQKYLEDPMATAFVWHRLADQYPKQLEQVLQGVLKRPEFQLKTDLDSLLEESGKPLEPDLPEIASVPVHLHNLFEDAVQEVNKSKPKSKEKSKKTGFGAR